MKNICITENDILDEAKQCFLTYAEEVLTDRAIPNAEDGLLSAQRKLLWTMNDFLKMTSKGKTKKCNSIVGSTLMTSYYHGDSACYGVLCKMAQTYLMRYPLVFGVGGLGTQEDNSMISSSRYTEAKPSKYADLMFNDFKKNVVPLKETYNGEFMEPVILPALFPNALVNGRESIGVSLSHGSLPNNLTEVCNGIIAYINNNDITISELMNYIPGPDFPLGGTVVNKKDIQKAFETGKSAVSLKVRGDYIVEGQKIIFTTIPYRTYRNKIKAQITKNIEEFEKYIEDFSDESNIGINRLIFTVKKNVPIKTAVEAIYRLTDLQTTLSYNMNFIINGTPQLCSLKTLIKAYVDHNISVLIKATEFDKEKAEKRLNVILGLLIALDKIDLVITLIKSSKSKSEAEEKLISALDINKAQADAILDMKLAKLTKMDKEELLVEKAEKEKEIIEYTRIIEDKTHREEVLIKKIEQLRDKYGDERRTKLIDLNVAAEPKAAEIVPPEECVVLMTENGNIKRIAAKSFRLQGRNGKGVKSQADVVSAIIKTNTIDQLLVFSDKGKMYKILVNDIPTGTNTSAGTAITSLINMGEAEIPILIYSAHHDSKAKYLCLITRNGKIKKTSLEECLAVKKKTGVPVIKLADDDILTSAFLLDEEEILVFNESGKCLRTDTKDISCTGRTAQGVKIMEAGIAAAMPIRDMNDDVFVVTEDGYGKRIRLTDFSKTSRTAKGVIVYKPEEHKIAGTAMVNDTDIILVTGLPRSICISMKGINTNGRYGLGIGIIKDSQVTSISKI